ncbi:MAG: hypothetical protein ACOX1U_02250 [Saccharofermentanales bacterium]|jgi:hypothetical protein|nr:hypothetical protein [Syntrophorhabdaceae bacterium]
MGGKFYCPTQICLFETPVDIKDCFQNGEDLEDLFCEHQLSGAEEAGYFQAIIREWNRRHDSAAYRLDISEDTQLDGIREGVCSMVLRDNGLIEYELDCEASCSNEEACEQLAAVIGENADPFILDFILDDGRQLYIAPTTHHWCGGFTLVRDY